jgi:hypothetical protein
VTLGGQDLSGRSPAMPARADRKEHNERRPTELTDSIGAFLQ